MGLLNSIGISVPKPIRMIECEMVYPGRLSLEDNESIWNVVGKRVAHFLSMEKCLHDR